MTRRAASGGRKPLPTKIKLLRGNPGRRPLNENEPEPEVRLPRSSAASSASYAYDGMTAPTIMLGL